MELESIPEQIEPTPEEIEQEEVPELDVEYTTRTDYISCAFYAISSVEGIDTGIMTKEDAKRIKRIMKKSLRIIDDCINEMHDELFEDEED
jgi:hypothetical protein